MKILIGAILGIIGILFFVVLIMGALLAVIEFLAGIITFIISFGAILFVGIVALIIGGIYFALSQFDPSIANTFLITSIGGIAAFLIFGLTAYNEKEDGIKIMNRTRSNAEKFSEEELNKFIDNESIGEFEKIGYMAAFADRYPPRKNLVDLSKS